MSQVQKFAFGLIDLRVIDLDGQPWFVAVDAYLALGLQQHGGILNPLSDDEKTIRGRTSVGMSPGRDIWLISESGLYKLIMRSRKPEAKAFQDWVTRVVLPAIRKDGAYVLGEEKVVTGEISEDELSRALGANDSDMSDLSYGLAEAGSARGSCVRPTG